MSSMKSSAGGKKQLNKNQHFRKQKVRNARIIRSEAILASNNKTANELTEMGSMLRVDQFINSRQFEIKQLQSAMHKSANSNATRVFQALPRKLRRRTASHNVKRIPKRMRNRALQEMMKSDKEANKNGNVSKSGVGKLNKNSRNAHGLSAASLYKAKMSVKLLRLASRSMSMKLALPKEITMHNRSLRQKIKFLKDNIKATEEGKPDKKLLLNNKLGSFDNTGLNQLAEPPRGRIKYFKRQKKFVWLPTHIWNAKRSHMIKRWGFQIPWSPTQKGFKLTHRLGGGSVQSDGTLCMDSSFMGTMIIRDKLEDGETIKTAISKLTNGRAIMKKYYTRGHLYEKMVYDKELNPLGPSNIIWLNKFTVMVRLHPALYQQVFNQLLEDYEDALSIEDCRYSLASITLRGSKTLDAMSSVLRSTDKSKSFEQFKKVCKVTDLDILPDNMLFAFNAIDPRHLKSPRSLDVTKKDIITPTEIIELSNTNNNDSNENEELQNEIKNVINKLFSIKGRSDSYTNQQTLKDIAKRRQISQTRKLAHGIMENVIQFDSKKDPSVPIIIYKRSLSNDWCIILPWFWQLPFWYQLNRLPRVYNMGIRQQQQLSFEHGKLYFPDDYPFTRCGFMENDLYKRLTLHDKWKKKAVGKRLNYDKLSGLHCTEIPSCSGEIGDYFSCDWNFLQILRNGMKYLRHKNNGQIAIIEPGKTIQFENEVTMVRAVTSLNELIELYKDHKQSKPKAEDTFIPITVNGKQIDSTEFNEVVDIVKNKLPVRPIRCQLIRRGRPTDNARIYGVPTKDVQFWNTVVQGEYKANGKLNNDLLVPKPSIQDLVGFVTSGSYHLGEGKGVAHGFIDSEYRGKFVLVRNCGSETLHIAQFSDISLQ